MLCLHGEKFYVGSLIKNGKTFWYCAHPGSSCHFKCTEDDAELYDKAVKEFLATKQGRPKCCAIKSTLVTNGASVEMPHLGRRYAKMKVVTDREKESYGRPFFVCSKKDDPCSYFAWGDKRIIPRPVCKHGKLCNLEKNDQCRYFFCCPEPKEKDCNFFIWFNVFMRLGLRYFRRK